MSQVLPPWLARRAWPSSPHALGRYLAAPPASGPAHGADGRPRSVRRPPWLVRRRWLLQCRGRPPSAMPSCPAEATWLGAGCLGVRRRHWRTAKNTTGKPGERRRSTQGLHSQHAAGNDAAAISHTSACRLVQVPHHDHVPLRSKSVNGAMTAAGQHLGMSAAVETEQGDG